MPTFVYKAKTGEGKLVTNVVEAENETMAVTKLQKSDLFLVSLTEEKAAAGLGREVSRHIFARIGSRDIAAFTRSVKAK